MSIMVAGPATPSAPLPEKESLNTSAYTRTEIQVACGMKIVQCDCIRNDPSTPHHFPRVFFKGRIMIELPHGGMAHPEFPIHHPDAETECANIDEAIEHFQTSALRAVKEFERRMQEAQQKQQSQIVVPSGGPPVPPFMQ